MSNYKLLGQVKDALEDLVDATRGPGRIWLPPNVWHLKSTNAPLAAYSAGGDTPGFALVNSKATCIKWDNHAAPVAIAANFFWPDDLDTSVGATFKALVSKIGATVGDATSLTIEIWNQVLAALHDADTDFGGATSAITGDATSKTIQQVSRAIAAGDLPATMPAGATISAKPTAGLLGTDELQFHGAWIEYTRKAIG